MNVKVSSETWRTLWGALHVEHSDPSIVWTARNMWELRAALWLESKALDAQRHTAVSHLMRGVNPLEIFAPGRRRASLHLAGLQERDASATALDMAASAADATSTAGKLRGENAHVLRRPGSVSWSWRSFEVSAAARLPCSAPLHEGARHCCSRCALWLPP